MQKDYYKILGVERNATEEDIKKAYRKLAHEHHPDKKGGDAERFKTINEAYQVLSSKEKRAQYDRFGNAFEGMGGQPNRGGNPFAGFDINFDPSMFEGMGGDAGEMFDAFFEGLGIRRRRRTYERGADLEASITVTLEEAFKGAMREIPVHRFALCATCAGAGYDAKEGVAECATCSGQGEVRETRRGFFGNSMHIRPCATCNGTGSIPNKPCGACAGAGRVKKKETISLTVMAGIETGQIVKITKAGDKGPRNAEAGDLYVKVTVTPHKNFDREHSDLFTKKEVSIIDLISSKKLEVDGLSGEKYSFDLPPEIEFSEPVRIQSAGMPHLNARGRGDLYVYIIALKPKRISAEAKRLLEELKRELGS